MIIKIFCIHDAKAAAYLPPFNLPSTEMALRTFADTVNDKQHSFSKHPGDYTLFEIGTFDDATGLTKNLIDNAKICHGSGLDFRTPPDHDDADIQMLHDRIDDLATRIGAILQLSPEAYTAFHNTTEDKKL